MDAVVDGRAGVFDVAGRLGFDGVELSLSREDLRSGDPGRRAAASRHHARDPSPSCSASTTGGIADANADVAARQPRTCAPPSTGRAGSGWARSSFFFMRAQLLGEDAFDRCTTAFASLCPHAAERGVTLLFRGLLPAREIRLLAERVSSPGFGCYFDLANPLRRGLDSATEIRALGDLIRRHIKDIRATPGDVRPGVDRVDFDECARALDEIGYDGWLTLETPTAPSPLVGRDLSSRAPPSRGSERASGWPRFAGMSHEPAARSWGRPGDGARRARPGLRSARRRAPGGVRRGPGARGREGSSSTRRESRSPGSPGTAISSPPIRRSAPRTSTTSPASSWPHRSAHGSSPPKPGRDPYGDWTDSPDNWGDEAWRLVDDALDQLRCSGQA